MLERRKVARGPLVLSDNMVRSLIDWVRRSGTHRPRTTAVVVNKRREILLVWQNSHNELVLPSFAIDGSNPILEAEGGLSRELGVHPETLRLAGGSYPLFTEEVAPPIEGLKGEYHFVVGFEYHEPSDEISTAYFKYCWMRVMDLIGKTRSGTIPNLLRKAAEWAGAFAWSDGSVNAVLERRTPPSAKKPGRRHYQRPLRRVDCRAA